MKQLSSQGHMSSSECTRSIPPDSLQRLKTLADQDDQYTVICAFVSTHYRPLAIHEITILLCKICNADVRMLTDPTITNNGTGLRFTAILPNRNRRAAARNRGNHPFPASPESHEPEFHPKPCPVPVSKSFTTLPQPRSDVSSRTSRNSP